MRRTLTSALPAATPGDQVRLAGLGPPPARAGEGHVPGGPRPHRAGPGRAARGHRPAAGGDAASRSTGTATANAAGARRRRGHRRDRDRARASRPTPRRSSCGGPTLDTGLPTLLDHAATTWRHPAQRAKWELAAASLRGFRETLDAEGFTEVHSPKLVESATESGANVFEVDYFGRPAYLAQSPQFYKQQLVGVFERVYEIGPVFRAEPHDTVRHLAEYVSLDVELGFVEDHREVIACLRDVVAGMVDGIRDVRRARRRAARARAAGGAGRAPDAPLPRGARDRRGAGRRARPQPGPRARARRVGARPSTAPTSSSSRATRRASRAFYSHPDPDDPHW